MGCAGSSAGGGGQANMQGDIGRQVSSSSLEGHYFLAVNGSSGGLVAQELLDMGVSTMHIAINEQRKVHVKIFNLKDKEQREENFARIAALAAEAGKYQVRVVACGGDGTVKWVIACLAAVNSLSVPIGVIPFGTGNDMARVLGWGHKPPSPLIGTALVALKKKILEIDQAERIPLDVWKCSVSVAEQGGKFEEIKDRKVVNAHVGQRQVTHEMINYFSIGADGELMFEFEQNRATTQMANKAVYARKGFVQTIVPPKRLETFMDTVIQGNDNKPVEVNKRHRQLLFLNIPSYGAGADPWRRSKDFRNSSEQGLSPQYVGDSKVEVLTVANTFNTGLKLTLGSNLGIARVTQGDSFSVTLKPGSDVYFQVDGEALKATNATQVSVSLGYQVYLLKNPSGKADAFPEGFAEVRRVNSGPELSHSHLLPQQQDATNAILHSASSSVAGVSSPGNPGLAAEDESTDAPGESSGAQDTAGDPCNEQPAATVPEAAAATAEPTRSTETVAAT